MLVHLKIDEYNWRELNLLNSSISEACTTKDTCKKYSYMPVDVPYYIKTFTWYDYYIGDVHYTSDQLLAHLSKHYPEFLI